MVYATLTSIASLASIISLCFLLSKSNETAKTYSLVVVSIGLSVISTFLWVGSANLAAEKEALVVENSRLQSAQAEARRLVESWPTPDRMDFVSSGELRGMVLSGIAFLEGRRDVFPETYENSKQLLLVEMGAGENEGTLAERYNLEEAGETIYMTVSSLANLNEH